MRRGKISGDVAAVSGCDVVGIGRRRCFRPVFGEGLCAEVGGHGAEHAMHDGGGALVDALLVECLKKQEEVDLNGGAVLGEDEGDGGVRAVGNFIEGDDPGERGFDGGVVIAESGSGDGGGAAGSSGGFDVGAKRDGRRHGILLYEKLQDLENKDEERPQDRFFGSREWLVNAKGAASGHAFRKISLISALTLILAGCERLNA